MGIWVFGEEEMIGLDIGEYGMEVYIGFVKEIDFFGSVVFGVIVFE